jgi:hypothetical protein
MNNYILLLLFCLMNSFNLASPKENATFKTADSDPVKKIVREMARSNVYEISTTIGYSGAPSKLGARYKELLKYASTDQLTELATKNKNAVVRLYAFNALVNKEREVPQAIIDQFRNDKTIITVLNGDTSNKSPVNVIAERCLY